MRTWLGKLCDISDEFDVRSDPTLAFAGLGVMTASNSYFRHAGLSDVVLRYLKASHCTFIEVEASAAAFDTVLGKFVGWVNATHELIQPGSLIAQMKRRHWLLAPDEVEV